jgi:hypothetical protein
VNPPSYEGAGGTDPVKDWVSVIVSALLRLSLYKLTYEPGLRSRWAPSRNRLLDAHTRYRYSPRNCWGMNRTGQPEGMVEVSPYSKNVNFSVDLPPTSKAKGTPIRRTSSAESQRRATSYGADPIPSSQGRESALSSTDTTLSRTSPRERRAMSEVGELCQRE